MTDKDVGELWAARGALSLWHCQDVTRLIVKLVTERAWAKNGQRYFTPHEQQVFLQDALRDFGIDPATWEAK